VIITRTDGKEVDTDCEYFAEGEVDKEYVKEHCFVSGTNTPKCKLWYECWRVFRHSVEEA